EPVARRVTPRPRGGAVVSRTGLWERLGGSARVTVVSAPAGSGKTGRLRAWVDAAGLARRGGGGPVGGGGRGPQRVRAAGAGGAERGGLGRAVGGALRRTAAGSRLVRELTAARDLDGWVMVERLLKDLAPLDEPLWLVIDDAHELGADQARRQLELLVMRAPE